MSKEKSPEKELKEKLFYKKKNIYQLIDDEEVKKITAFSENYKKFLDEAKTEREAVKFALSAAMERGFTEYQPGSSVPEPTTYTSMPWTTSVLRYSLVTLSSSTV
ncbi:MAG: hypothetical protein IKM72_10870, partial [Oscillospiraceae bacterium]|nr:hypothetical protein [Oscillospiraceae bacterium]